MFTRPLAAQGRPRRSPDHNTPPADVTASPPRAPRRSRVEYSARAALAAPSPAHRRAPRPDGQGRGLGTRPPGHAQRDTPPWPRPARGDGPGRAGGGAGHNGGRRCGEREGWGFAAPRMGRLVPRHPHGAEWGAPRPGPPTGGWTKRAVPGVGDRPHEPPVPVPVVPGRCPRTDAVARAARRRRRCGNANPSRRRGRIRQNRAPRPPVSLCRQPRFRSHRAGEVTRGQRGGPTQDLVHLPRYLSANWRRNAVARRGCQPTPGGCQPAPLPAPHSGCASRPAAQRRETSSSPRGGHGRTRHARVAGIRCSLRETGGPTRPVLASGQGPNPPPEPSVGGSGRTGQPFSPIRRSEAVSVSVGSAAARGCPESGTCSSAVRG